MLSVSVLGLASCVADRVPLECAPFARERSGVQLYGAAADWWQKADGRYIRTRAPVPGSVLVFRRSSRLSNGHVAVVTRVLSERQILVTHANWVHHRVSKDIGPKTAGRLIYLIDPSELHRVYPPVVFDNGSENAEIEHSQPLTTDAETALLRQDNMRLLEQIEMLRDERDDLRRRLDTEAEERRRLTLIVTDQRVKRWRLWPWVS